MQPTRCGPELCEGSARFYKRAECRMDDVGRLFEDLPSLRDSNKTVLTSELILVDNSGKRPDFLASVDVGTDLLPQPFDGNDASPQTMSANGSWWVRSSAILSYAFCFRMYDLN